MTTRGRCLLAGGLAAGACAFILDERDLLRVGVLAIVLPIGAYLLVAVRRLQLTAEHQVVPDQLTPGTVGQVRLTVVNTGRSRTGPLELAEPSTAGLTPGMRCLLPSLRRGRSAQATYRLYATRRGQFTVGPPRVRRVDPFGLWETVRELPATASVLVVPATVSLTGLPSGSGSRSAASGRAAIGSFGGDPDVLIRQYRNGDDIRTIHWRASARHDDLMVRLVEPVSHGGAVVMVDARSQAHRGSGHTSSLEPAISLAASVSLHLLNADHELTLTTHTGVPLTHGHDIADDVLAGLAVLDVDEQPISLPTVANSGVLVGVFGELDAAAARQLVVTRPTGVHAIALLLETNDWLEPHQPPAIPASAAHEALAAGGWRVLVVRRSDSFADVWRQACQSGEGFRGSRPAPRPRVGAR